MALGSQRDVRAVRDPGWQATALPAANRTTPVPVRARTPLCRRRLKNRGGQGLVGLSFPIHRVLCHAQKRETRTMARKATTAPRDVGAAVSETFRNTSITADGRKCAWCRGVLPARRRRFCTDECRRRGQKAERVIEDDSYAAGVVRLIRKMGVRASADLEALKWLAGAADHTRDALAMAVDGCRARGYSDGEIGHALGITRQAVGQRFGRKGEVYAGRSESAIIVPGSGR